MARTDDTWAPGTLIPGTDYRIVRLIGRGGFGEVFEVEHVHLTRRFAVKVLSRAYAGRGDLVERLKREARSLARLHPHPNLVEVTDLRQASDGRAFVVMERLRGRTLGESLRLGRASPIGHAVDVLRQLLRALGAAHRLGLVHRDVKPSNVFLCDDGTVKLLDFGIVKALTEKGGAQTMPGAAVGTPGYMAPESIEGAAPDARSDVYSAGVVLWEMLAGHPPFGQGQSGQEMLACALTQGVPALEAEGHGALPAALRAVVRKATARQSEDRYASADEFAIALEAAMREGDVPRPARVLKAPPPLPQPRVVSDAKGDSSAAPPGPQGAPDAGPSRGATASHCEATLPARYDATTALGPAPGNEAGEASDDIAADTLRAFFGDDEPGASLRSLFDESDSEAGPPSSRSSEPPSAPNPDRVEYALACVPAPHPGARATKKARGASRRVVLDLPPPEGSPVSAKSLAFAPTLPSASLLEALEPLPVTPTAPPSSAVTLASPESELGPPRTPSTSTVETHVRSLPTPTAVPNAFVEDMRPEGPEGPVAPAEGRVGRWRGFVVSRSSLAVIAIVVVACVAWAWARGRGGAGGPDNTVTDRQESLSVSPAASQPGPGGRVEAPAPATSLAPAPSVSAEAPPGEPELAPRASLASASSAASTASAASAASAASVASVASTAVLGAPAASTAVLGAPAVSAAALAAPAASAPEGPKPEPSAGASSLAPVSSGVGDIPPPTLAEVRAAPTLPSANSPERRAPGKPSAEASTPAPSAPRRDGKPSNRSRGRRLGPSHDF